MDRNGRVHNDAQMVGAMIPILSSSYPYTGNGLGGLSDCIEYTVTHEVNGEYEFSMKYPITGEHFDELAIDYFVTAIPDNLTPAQPFRIYRITKPLNGVVTVYARHISYDMSGIVVEPFSAGSLTEAMTVLPTKCTPASPVTIQTDRTVATGITLSEPRTLWKLLGGQAGSFLDVYGGEWDFNGLTATLKTRLGSDRGVEIRYGKNMTALEQDATIESTYSGVYPYWYDEESGTVVILPEKYVNISGALVSGRVLLLDLSGDFDDAPTVEQLRARAEQYIAANSVGSAKTSWKVSFQSLEDENRALESVMLGDTLKVKYSALGVDATSRVVKVEFDGLKERYKTVTIGRVKQNLAAIIVGNNQETQEKIDASAKSAYERAVDAATESIRNGAGTFRLIYNGENLQEIVSLDNADIALAESVWRWNNGGFGHSADGYNGTYTLALLPDGSINAAVITTGILNANVIRAGTLQDALGKNSWNLATGAFRITNGSINISTESATSDVIQLNYTGENQRRYSSSYTPNGVVVRIFDSLDSATPTYETYMSSVGVFTGYQYWQENGAWNGTPLTTLQTNGLLFRSFNPDNTPKTRKAVELTQTQFKIYDSNETLRTNVEQGALSQFNTDGAKTVYLKADGTYGGQLQLFDPTGAQELAAIGDQIGGGGVWLSNTSGNPVAQLRAYYTANGYGLLQLFDGSSSTVRAQLDQSGLKFNNASGSAVLTLSPNASGNITITPRVVATW